MNNNRGRLKRLFNNDIVMTHPLVETITLQQLKMITDS